MAIQDYLGRETVQMTVIIMVTMFFHYYFIKQRLYPDFPTNPRPEDDSGTFDPISRADEDDSNLE